MALQDIQAVSLSVDDLDAVARKILLMHPEGRIFAFYGEMGVGKTTFIKALCREMGVVDVVSSPTFALVNVYKTDSGKVVNHFDCYRMKSMEEAFDIGYEDYFYSGDPCLIEWPEKIEPLLPEETIRIQIRINPVSGDREFYF